MKLWSSVSCKLSYLYVPLFYIILEKLPFVYFSSHFSNSIQPLHLSIPLWSCFRKEIAKECNRLKWSQTKYLISIYFKWVLPWSLNFSKLHHIRYTRVGFSWWCQNYSTSFTTQIQLLTIRKDVFSETLLPRFNCTILSLQYRKSSFC